MAGPFRTNYTLPSTELMTAARLDQEERTSCSPWGGDAYVIVHYRDHGISPEAVIKRGYFPSNGNIGITELSPDEDAKKRKLFIFLEEQLKSFLPKATLSFGDNPNKPWKTRIDEHSSALFVQCNDGHIGIAWDEAEGSDQDAYNMCAFAAYALGYYNKRDRTLYSNSKWLLEGKAKTMATILIEGMKKLRVQPKAISTTRA